MQTSFGIRFTGVSMLSFCTALLLLYFQLEGTSPLISFEDETTQYAHWLAFYLVGLGYYRGFNTIFKTRVSPLFYLLYLIGGLVLVGLTLLEALKWLLAIGGEISLEVVLWALLLPLSIAFLPPFLIYQWQKLKEHPVYRQFFLEGKGGSSRWASVGTFDNLKGKLKQGFASFWFDKKGIRTDGIYLGRTLFSDDPFQRHVVMKEDCHNITVGLTGAGKTTTVQNHTYSLYEGSIIGFDPKGELSLATANRRHHSNLGGKKTTKKHFPNGFVTIFDPFGVNAKYGFQSTAYNCLAEIDINQPGARQLLAAISDACFTPEAMANDHFEENPKNIIEGFMTHVLTSYPKENHHLPFVYDLIRGINPQTGYVDMDYYKSVILAMSKNAALGGLAQEAARILVEMGPNERGSMQSTMSRHLKWIGDPQMRKHLSKSSFSFKDFGVKKVKGKETTLIETVYIVVPDQMIKEQMRYIRLMFNVALQIMQNRTSKPKIPTLVIIDEFPRLGGKVEAIAEGFGILRSYGIKLWVFIQTIGQLKADYPKRWSSMIGNSTVQAFGAGMGDNETAEFISKTLGARIIKRYERRKSFWVFSKKVLVNETARELLTPAEVTTKLAKSANIQIIFPNDGFPMRLERLAFKALKFGRRTFKSMGLGGLKKQIE